jgi:hypothetical protein
MCISAFSTFTDYTNTTFQKQTAFVFRWTNIAYISHISVVTALSKNYSVQSYHNLTVYFPIQHVQEKYTGNDRKNVFKNYTS